MASRFKLRVCTWNVGNSPPPDDLTAWLLGHDEKNPYLVIAIGVQESVYEVDRPRPRPEDGVIVKYEGTPKPYTTNPKGSKSDDSSFFADPLLDRCASRRKQAPALHLLSKAVKSLRRNISRSSTPSFSRHAHADTDAEPSSLSTLRPTPDAPPSPHLCVPPRLCAPLRLCAPPGLLPQSPRARAPRDIVSATSVKPLSSMHSSSILSAMSPSSVWSLRSSRSSRSAKPSDTPFATVDDAHLIPIPSTPVSASPSAAPSLHPHLSWGVHVGALAPPPQLPFLRHVRDPLALGEPDCFADLETSFCGPVSTYSQGAAPASHDADPAYEHDDMLSITASDTSELDSFDRDSDDDVSYFDSESASRTMKTADAAPNVDGNSAQGAGEADADGTCNTSKFAEVIAKNMPKEYCMVSNVQMREMQLFVYVHDSLMPRVESQIVMQEATGVANMVGNKGAVGAKLMIDGTSLCFINSHLAAHAGGRYMRQRHADVTMIMRHLERTGKFGSVPIVHRFDHLFWMGDLNYRLDFKLTIPGARAWSLERRCAYVHKMVSDGRIEDVATLDELRREMGRDNVFGGFVEGAMAFPPTFKVERGGGETGIAYQGIRVPSYCDRVLWRSQPMHQAHLKLREYDCVIGVDSSDHKPVFAGFDMVIPGKLNFLPFPAPVHSLKCSLDLTFLEVVGFTFGGRSSRSSFSSQSVASSHGSSGASGDEDDEDEETEDDTWGTGGSSSNMAWSGEESDDDTSSRRKRKRRVHVAIDGHGLFVKQQTYKLDLPLRDGTRRMRYGDELPCIALKPVATLDALMYKYVVIVIHRTGNRTGKSCVLPLAGLLPGLGIHQKRGLKLNLTKFGIEARGLLNLDLAMVVAKDRWRMADNRLLVPFSSQRWDTMIDP